MILEDTVLIRNLSQQTENSNKSQIKELSFEKDSQICSDKESSEEELVVDKILMEFLGNNFIDAEKIKYLSPLNK